MSPPRMTFEEWVTRVAPSHLNDALAEAAWSAGRSQGRHEGFSLGTEAAAKAADELGVRYYASGAAKAIRALRYEDVKGEKDG